MAERHGYEPLGIGASTLAFSSTLDRPERRDIDALVTDLQHLYGHPAEQSWNELGEMLRVSPVLILGYTENLADLSDDEI
jgi:hypothetical protein